MRVGLIKIILNTKSSHSHRFPFFKAFANSRSCSVSSDATHARTLFACALSNRSASGPGRPLHRGGALSLSASHCCFSAAWRAGAMAWTTRGVAARNTHPMGTWSLGWKDQGSAKAPRERRSACLGATGWRTCEGLRGWLGFRVRLRSGGWYSG